MRSASLAHSIVLGGALAMCSTAIVLQQLGDQDELNRTHGRLSFAVLLFQDLAFVPLLALASVQAQAQSVHRGAGAAAGGAGTAGADRGAGDRALGAAAAAV
jgi:Kef-type K+ transport system membrane component KefB